MDSKFWDSRISATCQWLTAFHSPQFIQTSQVLLFPSRARVTMLPVISVLIPVITPVELRCCLSCHRVLLTYKVQSSH